MTYTLSIARDSKLAPGRTNPVDAGIMRLERITQLPFTGLAEVEDLQLLVRGDRCHATRVVICPESIAVPQGPRELIP